MIEYGVSQGIDEKVARSMAQNAMLGAAKMLLTNEKTPEELIEMVRSKKGTTDAALNSLADDKFRDIIFKALDACTKRAVELGK